MPAISGFTDIPRSYNAPQSSLHSTVEAGTIPPSHEPLDLETEAMEWGNSVGHDLEDDAAVWGVIYECSLHEVVPEHLISRWSSLDGALG